MREGKDAFLFRIASAAYDVGFTPNAMTALGLAFGVSSGTLFALRAVPFGFAFGFLSVFCDVLDGTLARKFHMETRGGLVFDSVADRVSESAVVLGALVSGTIQPWGIFAIVGSAMLLTTRALSYSRGLKTDYVLFGRFERLVCILIGLILPIQALSTACFVVAGIVGAISFCQIVIYLRCGQTNKK